MLVIYCHSHLVLQIQSYRYGPTYLVLHILSYTHCPTNVVIHILSYKMCHTYLVPHILFYISGCAIIYGSRIYPLFNPVAHSSLHCVCYATQHSLCSSFVLWFFIFSSLHFIFEFFAAVLEECEGLGVCRVIGCLNYCVLHHCFHFHCKEIGFRGLFSHHVCLHGNRLHNSCPSNGECPLSPPYVSSSIQSRVK